MSAAEPGCRERGEPRPLPWRTAIAAHRGGAGLWPENSRRAFANACRMPIELVELDVHLSRDGEPVVIHDATLDRTTDATGPVSERSWPELRAVRLQAAPEETLPHLEDVLDIVEPSRLGIRLEVKLDREGRRHPLIEPTVIRALDRRHLLPRTVFTSFDPDTLLTLRELGISAGLVLLLRREAGSTPGALGRVLDRAAVRGLPEVAVHASLLAPPVMDAGALRGLRVGAYGANDEARMRHALALGASAFTTDRPDLALRVRERAAAG